MRSNASSKNSEVLLCLRLALPASPLDGKRDGSEDRKDKTQQELRLAGWCPSAEVGCRFVTRIFAKVFEAEWLSRQEETSNGETPDDYGAEDHSGSTHRNRAPRADRLGAGGEMTPAEQARAVASAGAAKVGSGL